MRIYSQTELDRLIHCEKIMVKKLQPLKTEGRYRRANINIKSKDGKEQFQIFVRQLVDLPEDFSVGLRYVPDNDKDITLVRCNGDHGGHRNRIIDYKLCEEMHIHIAREEAFRAGLDPDHFAIDAMGHYSNLNDAVKYFSSLANIKDGLNFPPIDLDLFANDGNDNGN